VGGDGGGHWADLDELLLCEGHAHEELSAPDELEGQAAQSAGELLASIGEPRFRELETRALMRFLSADRVEATSLADRRDEVLATGGGVILDPENRASLRRACLVVWLDAPVDVLAARLAEDATVRPSLTGAEPAEELAVLAASRAEFYREVAHLRLDASRSVDDMARELGKVVLQQADGGFVLADSSAR